MEKQIGIKIIKLSIFVVITFYSNRAYSQSILAPIKMNILNSKPSYNRSDTVKLRFENLTNKVAWFVVGLEVFNEGQWKETICDIDNPISGVEKIYTIKKEKSIYLLAKKVPLLELQSSQYRLFVKYSFNHKMRNFKEEHLVKLIFHK